MGVEVGAALAAADALGGQRVLEDLLKAEELDNADVDARVEAQAALVGAQGRVELDAEAAVDVDGPGVVDPRHAEDDLALGLDNALQERVVSVVGVLGDHRVEGLQHLAHSLVELGLATVACDDLLIDLLNNVLHGGSFVYRNGPRRSTSSGRRSPAPDPSIPPSRLLRRNIPPTGPAAYGADGRRSRPRRRPPERPRSVWGRRRQHPSGPRDVQTPGYRGPSPPTPAASRAPGPRRFRRRGSRRPGSLTGTGIPGTGPLLYSLP